MTSKKYIKNIIPERPENPFVVPEGYFEGLEERLMKRIRSGEVGREKPGATETDTRSGKAERRTIRLGKNGAVMEDPAVRDNSVVKERNSERERHHITEQPSAKRVSLRPYLTLAASMSGIALIIYILLQTVVGSRLDEYGLYDMAVLEQAGVSYDEAIIAETYSMDEESTFSDWDRDAMVYLSSNEVDLIHLLDEN
jgi:hypothetical protein